ncbi:ImmA/IrrE family metallo-endopeptidase [Lactococcus allomyrinae]|uniref:ImmA/IrrE family metallo-endopeptidase n=1 Tax=Lactococcus allomyrinae TaxID=2419773 RepID=A0A387BML3_9LACT|nr:ImmA/IrrE family metallo-endopeptidase [Lactococcus allomyrinae]AYF99770.1 ImmA/IrrE family metallo-endopeptidase [Lactococcus allomyrinae]
MGKYNYSRINYTTQKILVEKCDITFPINILQLLSNFPNIHLDTYEKFNTDIAPKLGKKAEQISDEAFSCKTGTNAYIIFYNDNTIQKIPQRIRFSLAHELGHILLGHFVNYSGLLPRNGFGRVNSILEGEADTFASELLCPTCATSGDWSKEFIEKVFDVSALVAQNTLHTRQKYPWLQVTETFKDYFDNKIKINLRKNYFDMGARNASRYSGLLYSIDDNIYHFCRDCKSFEINLGSELKFCSICGSDNLEIVHRDNYFQFHETDEQLIEFFARGDKRMKYRVLKLDKEGRLAEPCPICGNEHPSKNYCSVCGLEIINKCTGIKKTVSGILTTTTACSAPLKGHERYCPECGAMSTFLENGFLPAWNESQNSDKIKPLIHEDKIG